MDLSRPRQLVQIVSAALMLVGLFVPVIQMPFHGRMSLISHDAGSAVLVLLLGLASIGMALRASTRWVPVLGAVALLLLAWGLIDASKAVDDPTRWPRQPLSSVLEDRPALADVEPGLRWGWVILLLGAAGLTASALLPAATEDRPEFVTGAGRYRITGYERDTGNPTTTHIEADSAEDAENRAVKDGIIVTDVAFDPIRRGRFGRVFSRP